MNSQSPKRALLQWTSSEKIGLLIMCFVIAIISSYKLLAVPDLKPGDIAPFNERAPKSAVVTDTFALKQKRLDLITNTSVQVIDEIKTNKLEEKILEKLVYLEEIAISNNSDRISLVNLTKKEKLWLLKISESERKKWQQEVILAAKRMLYTGVINTLPYDQIQKSASFQLYPLADIKSPSITLGSKLISETFKGETNLRDDEAKSQQLLEELLTKQTPTIKVNKDDTITKKGEKISQKDFILLDHFKLIRRRARPLECIGRFSEALISSWVLLMIMRREKPSLKAKHGALSLMLLIITQVIAQVSEQTFGEAISPLHLLIPPTLLISQGIGTTSSLGWLAIGSLLWQIPLNEIGKGKLIITALISSIVAFQGGRMRSRAQLLQIVIFLPFSALVSQWILFKSPISPYENTAPNLTTSFENLLIEAVALGAMLMFTVFLIPIIENTFGLLTKARLMELADQERPLLRRLSREAPGTFEHTLMICGLAEEGARSIGADVDLIRTGALYHDVGKLHAPEWFIENQEDGTNPHDQLNDPFKSADILQAHVDEGLKLARRHRLPSPIADFIPEHQGTLKMGYFLHKARELDDSVSENKFRYKGPIPASRETGILMLADGCEAALRSLDAKCTDKEACKTIRKIVESRQIDGQLRDSSLTRAELELIVRAFVSVWRRMSHRRIKYPIYSRKSSYPA